jgi:RNA polymerase sigma factor (sigma-70 family)
MSGMSITTTAYTTTDLVQAAREGAQGAVEQLMRRYERLVWATVRTFQLRDADCHDAVQNTWLKMIEHLDSLNDAERLPGWLSTTARRECLKIIRSGRRETVGLDPSLLERVDELFANPERAATRKAMHALLWEGVAALPEAGRALLVTLTSPDAPKYKDYAAATGMPVGAIGPTRMRYLRRLRKVLEQNGLGAHAWLD